MFILRTGIGAGLVGLCGGPVKACAPACILRSPREDTTPPARRHNQAYPDVLTFLFFALPLVP